MHKILFRGKRKDNGEWVEGYYVHYDDIKDNHKDDCDYIVGIHTGEHFPFFEVIPETVGQYTGLTAKNGKIFEGDIFKPFDDEICYVAWIEYFSTLGLMVHSTLRQKKRGKEISHFLKGWTYLTEYSLNELEIIGNIHDNPEPLKGGEE